MKEEIKLTEQQESKVPEYVQKWWEIGVSCAPIVKEDAEKAIKLVYEKADIPFPGTIIWTKSPFAMCLLGSILSQESMDDAHQDILMDKILSFTPSNDKKFVDLVKEVMGDIKSWYGPKIVDTVEKDLPVDEGLISIIKQGMSSLVNEACYGYHDANWLAFYDFFREVVGCKDETEKLVGLIELAKTCGWIIIGQKLCLASERTNAIHFNENNVLHNMEGPAISFSDGYRLFLVNGTTVPPWIIEDKASITFEKINAEENAEIRRIMTDIYGEEKYVSHFDPIQKDEFGELYKAEFKDDEPIVKVKVYDSTTEADGTRRTYFISVDKDTQTARQGVAKSFGFDNPDDYRPVMES